ncbi:ABC transporter substrate-binding protein [Peptococcus simiae]|uniref:ABC transporter substrate-binding protein n=1 Tax=Peptococcus simiae TaxID=1643805 RepID=A0ABW9GZH5_9FIRM
MKKISPLVAVLLAVTLLVTGCAGSPSSSDEATSSAVAETLPIKVATLAQIDAWPLVNAVQDGATDRYGLQITDKDMTIFDSGMEAVEGIPAKAFTLADIGQLPALMAASRYKAKIVGVAAEESAANAILARADSPVFNEGNSAEAVRGATVLVTSVSSAHQLLAAWLQDLGLTENDITIRTVEQQTAISAFEAGDGDFLVLWSPALYRALDKGFKVVKTAADLGLPSYMFYVVPENISADESEAVARFLAMTDGQVASYQAGGGGIHTSVKDFFKSYAGMTISDNDVTEEINRHQLYRIDEQLALFENGSLETTLADLAEDQVANDKLAAEDVALAKENHFYLDKRFLEAARGYAK